MPCGFPATANDIELRMKQGFSVFVMNWGDAGFRRVEIGRKDRRTVKAIGSYESEVKSEVCITRRAM